MLSRFTEKNTYGAHTWEIKLDSLFKILIHETNANSYAVELKEWKWVYNKKHLSFISNGSMDETIILAFDNSLTFLQGLKDFNLSEGQWDAKIALVFKKLEYYREYIIDVIKR